MGETLLSRVLALLLLRFSVSAAISQDCSLPDVAAINTNLRSLLTSVGGEGLLLLPHYSNTTSPVWLLVVAVISTEKWQWLSDTPRTQQVDISLHSFR